MKYLHRPFLYALLLILSSCAPNPVNPKTDPLHFNISDWIPHRHMMSDGHLGPFDSKGKELKAILAQEFPVGTPRTEIEKYLLASGNLHSVPTKSPTEPEEAMGLHCIFYIKEQKYDERPVGIRGWFDKDEILRKPLLVMLYP